MRLLIVSNRLPIVTVEEKGQLLFRESAGGLVSGISAYLDSLRGSSFTGSVRQRPRRAPRRPNPAGSAGRESRSKIPPSRPW